MKRIMAVTMCLIIAIVMIATGERRNEVKALEGDPFNEPVKIRCTGYLDSGTTYSGVETRRGIVAGKKEWQGCVAALYEVNEDGSLGDFIGYFEVLDTGYGIKTADGGTIQNGESIDVWQPSEAALKSWVNNFGDYVYVKLTRGVG